MASLPKPLAANPPLTVDELARIAGTPEFEAEYRRQMAVIAEHQGTRGVPDYLPLDEDSTGWS